MINISICEDNSIQLNKLVKFIDRWANEKILDVDVSSFSNAEKFLFNIEDIKYDILLLDIVMGDINGIELAKSLRAIGDDAVIIFITGISDFVFEGYEVNALNYILKPISYNELSKNLNNAIEKLTDKKIEYVMLDKLKVNINEIIYFEAMGHIVKLVMQNDIYKIKMTINMLKSMLPTNIFISPHRSYIINIMKVKQLKANNVIMDNKDIIPISRSNIKMINDKFISCFTKEDI